MKKLFRRTPKPIRLGLSNMADKDITVCMPGSPEFTGRIVSILYSNTMWDHSKKLVIEIVANPEDD